MANSESGSKLEQTELLLAGYSEFNGEKDYKSELDRIETLAINELHKYLGLPSVAKISFNSLAATTVRSWFANDKRYYLGIVLGLRAKAILEIKQDIGAAKYKRLLDRIEEEKLVNLYHTDRDVLFALLHV